MKALLLDAEWNPRSEYDLTDSERETQKAHNSAQVWQHPEMNVEDRPRPEPEDDEVLIEVAYAGVCGSDCSMIQTDEEGYMHYSAYTQFPNVTGHEFSGRIAETGDDANLFEPGERVTSEVVDYCGRCQQCRRGFHGHCENFEQVGFTIPGAFAEYVTVPEKIVWSVESLANAYEDEDELLRAAATIEPSTITYHGIFVRSEGVLPGDHHVYHGTGPIGLTGMNLSRAAGAGKVIGFDPSPERRSIAADLGFDHVYDPTEQDPVEVIDKVTDGRGADVHLETAGAVTETYPVIQETLAEEANVVHVSNASSAPNLATRKYQGSSAQLYGTEGHTGQQIYPRVIRLMSAGRLDNTSIITSTYSLSNADKAIEQAAKRVDGKVLIEI
ncbi:scyllo-inosose 3-dehydrogenase [Haloterrigena salifodinae]|uniref:Alcohol dehydrogenase catalytic domain-containing protein n=1 Tax=Haloterrigena salifodinae TaxID=2675099 RepID=A0A8T8E8E6_9EURY|nr:scyllo-inosose 3-dehydrogenase [Haloterrigena salifodinae]QRV17696.1 alcohol dehydrogenase catalytic domain-containing protein [Haloterrigena salifodinae]